MKSGLIFVAAIVSLMTSSTSAGQGNHDIITEQEFLEKIVGAKLTFYSGDAQDSGYEWFVVNGDGTLNGEHGGMDQSGNWVWTDQFWCRTKSVGGRVLGNDCQLVTIIDNKVVFQHMRGNGDNWKPFEFEGT